ncbi:MAG TPA: response regulator [Chloroflexota bacterium]|jgi:CheY-like chemotaxis protein
MARVLVVEDDPAGRDAIQLCLESDGHEVILAEHGEAALTLAAESPPDLILLDMRLPVMDGWAFAQAYRQQPGPRAPIVVVTASADAGRAAAEVKAAAFLGKPFDLQDLLETVARVALK